jgi:predicted AlkP superfamily pyrophosphatase or phosphodiesterase
MKRSSLLLTSSLLAICALLHAQHGPRSELVRPRLIVGIVIDQFRYDYLTRFRTEYTGAFAQLWKQGAVFTNAQEDHYPTVTAVGHATFLSGAIPAISGIVNNEWYDRATGGRVTSVSDPGTQLLGGPGAGSSPHRLLVSTVGDEMKIAGRRSKVIGISLKDRAAILPSGHMADGAYWFSGRTGNFVSSSFYFPALPAWVQEFNAQHLADRYAGHEWKALDSGQAMGRMPAKPGPGLWGAEEASPFGNELTETFTERAIEAEQLGHHPDTDLLTVSFSSNDYVGHAYGPDSPQVHDMCLRTDRLLEKLFRYIDAKVGLANTLIVLTADHGVAPVPELEEQRKMPAGRLSVSKLFDAMETALKTRYGEGQWIVGNAGADPYLNYALIDQKKLSLADVENTAAEAVRRLPHIFRVYTGEQLARGEMLQDRFGRRVARGYCASRSPDIIVIQHPYWLWASHGASHGTPFNYDSHVPVIFLGPDVRPGLYDEEIAENDIAPTLATILQVEIPGGSVGRVLSEMFPREAVRAGHPRTTAHAGTMR